MKPMLKAPKSKRLKHKMMKLLSKFAFRLNLRRYTAVAFDKAHALATGMGVVGWCRLTQSKPC
jgi:hypothetical protein